MCICPLLLLLTCSFQLVLSLLGALNELVESLATQRLTLAPFARAEPLNVGADHHTTAAPRRTPGGLLRVGGVCYHVWAQPMHPYWVEVRRALHRLAVDRFAPRCY
jgi:hypothetical protein